MPAAPTSPRPLPWHWRLLEAYFARAYRTEILGGEPGSLFAFNLFAHRGPEIVLKCGTRVRAGDTVMEVHFRREGLAPLAAQADSTGLGLGLLLLADREVPRLAGELARDPRFAEVKALHALTLFHRGIRRYGFEVFPVRERPVERWFTWWQKLLLRRDHPHGEKAVAGSGEAAVVRHVWVSREALVRRYGPTSTTCGSSCVSGGRMRPSE